MAEGKPLTTDVPHYGTKSYKVSKVETDFRALRNFVAARLNEPSHGLVDVRSNDEYTGKISRLQDCRNCRCVATYPGAKNIPWSQAVNEMGLSSLQLT